MPTQKASGNQSHANEDSGAQRPVTLDSMVWTLEYGGRVDTFSSQSRCVTFLFIEEGCIAFVPRACALRFSLLFNRTEALSTEMAAYYPTGYFREDTLTNSKSELEFHPTDSCLPFLKWLKVYHLSVIHIFLFCAS